MVLLLVAEIVISSLIHIIDIRSRSDYESGHIKGAVNKSYNDIPSYLELGYFVDNEINWGGPTSTILQ